MALYQYNCPEHGSQVLFQSMNEVHEAICSVCKKPMQRIFTAPAIKIKGNIFKPKTRAELFSQQEHMGYMDKEAIYHDKHTYFDNNVTDSQ
jgi:putative FmdB family regulatory protein